ncbi:hypothetical protein KI387_036662, partial [Taxus chinensis]
IQEYDLDIKPTKLVRGRGLCQLIAENEPRDNSEEEPVEENLPLVVFVSTTDEWYSDMPTFSHM